MISGGEAKSKYSLLSSLKVEITGVISGGEAKKLEQQLKCHSFRMPFLCFIRILSNAAQFESCYKT